MRKPVQALSLMGVVSLILFATVELKASQWHLSENSKRPVDASLFSLNMVNLEIGAGWPTFPFYGWRIFHSAWPKVEPAEGEWNFELLDSDIDLAEKKSVEPLLVLAMTPTWASSRPDEKGCCKPLGSSAEPKSLALWEAYVRKVATRYKGRVKQYELWNEPNIHKNYTGSVETLIKMSELAYKALKEIDPEINVVSPSMAPGDRGVPYLFNYLKKGGYQYADVIGFHFYAGPYEPERTLRKIHGVLNAMQENGVGHLELWNTESGWKIKNEQPWHHGYGGSYVLETEVSAAYAIRSYLLYWSAGITRFYWYAWGHMTMGLSDVDAKTPKLSALAYSLVQDWMLGATVSSCEQSENYIWTCDLKAKGGEQVFVLWSEKGDKKFSIPSNWGVKSIQSLQEKTQCVNSDSKQTLLLTEMPKLLSTKPAGCLI